VSKEIKLLIDGPPLAEAKVNEGYKAVAGNEPRVELTDGEHGCFHCEGLVGFLELRVVLESWDNLPEGKEGKLIEASTIIAVSYLTDFSK
jgi:hypothetical protein